MQPKDSMFPDSPRDNILDKNGGLQPGNRTRNGFAFHLLLKARLAEANKHCTVDLQ